MAPQPLLIVILGWASCTTSNRLHLLHPIKLVCGGYWWGLNHSSFIKATFTPRLQVNSAIIFPQNPFSVSIASSSRNYRGIKLWLHPPKAFLWRYRMVCWTVLSSKRFNEKKPQVPACIRVRVCPFPNLSIPFSICASLLGCRNTHEGLGSFVAVVVFKSPTLQKVGWCSQFQREMRRWGKRRRELPISLESLPLQIILSAVGEGLAQWAEQGETDPVDEDKEQHWAQKGEGEERGHSDLAGHSCGTLLCLIRVGFTAGMLLRTHLCAHCRSTGVWERNDKEHNE